MLIRCKSCFQEYEESFGLCPNCGYVDGEPPAEVFCLSPGTVIADRYIVGGMLGLGGFGITYKAWDKKLDTVLAVKEYYPSGLVNRHPGSTNIMLVATKREREFIYGKTRFLDEARNMAKFSTHKNIVNVFDFFEANNTAYIVMEFLDGRTLSQVIQQQNVPLPYDYCVNVAVHVCDALKDIHKENILHRDISPDNIMICNDGNVKLFDFGAARFSAGIENRVTVIVKPGFAPPEQYDKVNRQDPRTDIYALGATLYYAMTGVKPEESTNRKIEDTLRPPADLDDSIPENISNAIMRAMALEQQYRFATADDFSAALSSGRKVASVQKERAKRWRRRIVGICASFLAIIGVAATVVFMLKEQRDDVLPDADLCLWYIQTGDEAVNEHKAAALEDIIERFTEEYKSVSIELLPVAEQNYEETIAASDDFSAKPSIFESTGLNVSELADELPPELKQQDEACITSLVDEDGLKMATGIVTPVIYVNSARCSLKTATNLNEIRQQCDDEELTMLVGMAASMMFERLYGPDVKQYVSDSALDEFLNHSADIYMGISSDYFDVQAAMPGEYSVIVPGRETQTWEYASQWSISNLDGDNLKAAEAFLQYLVSPLAQDYFHIQNQSGELPVAKSSLDEYVKIYGELQGIAEFLERTDVAADVPGSETIPTVEPEPVESEPARLETAVYDTQRMDLSVRNSSGEIMAELYYDLITLSSSGDGVDKINQTLNAEYQEYKTNCQGITAERLSEEPFLPYFNTRDSVVSHNEGGIFSVIFTDNWYWGGVHNINYYGDTFDLNSGERLGIKDLLSVDETIISTYLKETAKQYIRSNPNSNYFTPGTEEIIDAYELDAFPFYIDDGQIFLCFETYVLASGADGPIVIPTGLFLGQEASPDLLQVLQGGQSVGTWSWLAVQPEDGATLIGQLHFNQDMTYTMGFGYYASEFAGGHTGRYELSGNTLILTADNSESAEKIRYEFQVETIGNAIAFTQVSEMGPFYFYEKGTVLILQPDLI